MQRICITKERVNRNSAKSQLQNADNEHRKSTDYVTRAILSTNLAKFITHFIFLRSIL